MTRSDCRCFVHPSDHAPRVTGGAFEPGPKLIASSVACALFLSGCGGAAPDSSGSADTTEDTPGAGGGAYDCGKLVEETVPVAQLPFAFDSSVFESVAGTRTGSGMWWNGDSVAVTVTVQFSLDAVGHQGWSRPDASDPTKCAEQWWVASHASVAVDGNDTALTADSMVYLDAGVPSGLVPFHGGVGVSNGWWPSATRWPPSVSDVVEASSSIGFTFEANGSMSGLGTIVPVHGGAPADTGGGDSPYVEMFSFAGAAK